MANEKLSAEKQLALIRYALTTAQKVCHGRFCDPHPLGQAEVCKASLEAIALLDTFPATVRKEEREAAWRDAMEIAKAEAFERRMAFNVYDALKAKLAENRKGEG